MSKGYTRANPRASVLRTDVDPTVQVQNVKKSNVYVFGDADVEEDEIVEYEMSEMRSRNQAKKKKRNDDPLFFDRKITDGDTLQSLSLQFGCPVAELKRVNNFLSDQDFYSRRSIKIPIKRYSFLTELIDKQKEEETESNVLKNGMTIIDETNEEAAYRGLSETDNDSLHDLSDPETQRQVIRTISINDSFRSQSREAKEFLKNMDKDLSKIRNSRQDRNSLDEVVSLLTSRRIQPFPKKPAAVNWTDCGIRWSTIIILIIVVAILVPLILFFYYELKP